MKPYLPLIALMAISQIGHAQDNKKTIELKEVKGRVIDSATRLPAAGIRITAYNNRSYTAMTDEDGNYTIHIPVWVGSLTVEAEGYNLVQQPIGSQTEVLTTYVYPTTFTPFYDAQTKATSGRHAQVDYNNVDISIDNQLQTKLGGDIRTTTRSGIPGSGISMFMNGLNSLNSNAQPLVIIDGVIQDMQLGRPSLHSGFFNNLLAGIMVEDIENIRVLKNGTAIYGAKGANGVVIVETKRNKSMATRIDLSIGGSFELQPRQPDMMNASQYRIYASELIGTTGSKSNSFKFLNTDPSYYYYNMYHNQTDWSEVTYDEAFTQNYSLNVQGGDDVANYNLSVGYAKADATLRNTDFSRFNLRLNSDIVLARNVTTRFDASYSDITRDMRDMGIKSNVDDGIISSPSFLSLIKAPFLSPYAFDASGNRSNYMAEADDYLSDVLTTGNYTTSLANPLSILRNGDGDNKNYFGNRMVSISIKPTWDINTNWSLTEHFAFQLVNTDENYYLPTNGVPNYIVEGIGQVENCASSLAGKQTIVMSDTYARFHKRTGVHLFDVRGGLRYYNNSYKLNTQLGYNTGNDKTPNMSSSLSYKQTDGTNDHYIDMNYYAQADYNYAEKYYLSAALSMNGNSKFGVDADEGVHIGNYAWGFFPSLEAAWVASNEKWFHVAGVDHLRLNAGFDLVGNDDMDANASRSYFVAGKIFDQLSGKTLGNIGNTRLQWETTARLTAGLQLAAFHNRLFVGVNYFYGNTYNLLSLNALSYLTGEKTNWTNGGRITNQGFDASITGRILTTRDFSFEMGVTVGHYKNTIKRLPSSLNEMTTELYGANILSRVGESAGMFYGYRTEGVFSTTEEANAAALYQTDRAGQRTYFGAGDIHFTDRNNDHCINESDMTIIGDPNPDFYGNISARLAYKRLTLDLAFNYSLGNDIYNYQRSLLESGSRFYNQTTNLLQRWTTEGQNTSVPRATFADPMGNARFSDRWIEDGSYLMLKNVTLAYTLPIRNTYLQGLTIWAAANNLFTITKYLGGSPENAQSNSVLGIGIDRGLLSLGRNFALGLKINL